MVPQATKTMPMGSYRVAVIGGGLTGLSAAHRLVELARHREAPLTVTVFEAGSRLGGVMGTRRIGGYLVDTGADSFLTNKPAAVALCRRLGIEHRLIPTDIRYRGALVLSEGRPVPVPDGFQLLIPTAMWPMVTTPLLSPWGKLRLLMEYFVPPRRLSTVSTSDNDGRSSARCELPEESLADFVRRRFGRETFERLVQPLVGGIYTADPERLSVAATMPRFLDMEQEYGSLMRAAWHRDSGENHEIAAAEETRDVSRKKWRVRPSRQGGDASSSGARYGMFAGLAGGMEDLLGALTSRVETDCTVHLKTRITAVSRTSAASAGYQLAASDGSLSKFDAVIISTPAYHAATMLELLDSKLAQELNGIEYASSAIVVTGHKLADVRHPLQSFGLVVPQRERRRILAASFSSRKFPDRAPADSVLIRTFVGGAMQAELLQREDNELVTLVREELADIFGVQGDPEIALVVRYPRAMPQYHVGHLDRVARIENLTSKYTGVHLAGNAYRGVGIPDTILNGEMTAEAIVDRAMS